MAFNKNSFETYPEPFVIKKQRKLDLNTDRVFKIKCRKIENQKALFFDVQCIV